MVAMAVVVMIVVNLMSIEKVMLTILVVGVKVLVWCRC